MDHHALQRSQRRIVLLESLGRFWYFELKMAAPKSKSNRSTADLSLRQRQRRRPSRMNSRPVARRTPSENLKLGLELSDLCYALQEAGRKSNQGKETLGEWNRVYLPVVLGSPGSVESKGKQKQRQNRGLCGSIRSVHSRSVESHCPLRYCASVYSSRCVTPGWISG